MQSSGWRLLTSGAQLAENPLRDDVDHTPLLLDACFWGTLVPWHSQSYRAQQAPVARESSQAERQMLKEGGSAGTRSVHRALYAPESSKEAMSCAPAMSTSCITQIHSRHTWNLLCSVTDSAWWRILAYLPSPSSNTHLRLSSAFAYISAGVRCSPSGLTQSFIAEVSEPLVTMLLSCRGWWIAIGSYQWA